jgi:hypothetical protein
MIRMLIVIATCMVCSHAASAGMIVATTTDFMSGNTTLYDTDSGKFVPNALGHADQDVTVVTDGVSVYVLSRSLGAVSKYDSAEITGDALVYQYSVGPTTNPYDIVFAESGAYVIRYGSPDILVVDQDAPDEASFATGTIDICAFDTDGVPEAVCGFAYDGMVYVVLQRLIGWEEVRPGYLLKINPATNAIVDLDPGTEGVQGLELLVRNPRACSVVDGIAYIDGHDWGEQNQGVQTINLTDPSLPQAMLLEEATLFMDITRSEVLDPATGIVYTSSWVMDGSGGWEQIGMAYWYDPVTGVLGDALPVPTPEGGAVMEDGIVYVGSRDNTAPGIYPVDPATNTLAGDPLLSTLPPYSMIIVGGEDPTLVADARVSPRPFTLDAPYPNPFNPTTTITFELTEPGMTTVEVFNVAGQTVATLASGPRDAGMHRCVWNAADCAAGAYFVRVRHAGGVRTAKMLLVK